MQIIFTAKEKEAIKSTDEMKAAVDRYLTAITYPQKKKRRKSKKTFSVMRTPAGPRKGRMNQAL
jgi:hypothetical protein